MPATCSLSAGNSARIGRDQPADRDQPANLVIRLMGTTTSDSTER